MTPSESLSVCAWACAFVSHINAPVKQWSPQEEHTDFHSKRSTGRSTRHHPMNTAIWWALKHANVPATKEPMGQLRCDEKGLDDFTLVPWQRGCCLIWDVSVVETLANSYIPTTSVTPCRAAEAAATRKRAKYADIIQSHIFVPIAIETVGPINMDGQRFLDSLGEHFLSVSGDARETTYLYQRISAVIKIFNLVAFVVLSLLRQ